MKLAFCIFRYFPFGGLQQDMLRIARACLERAHQVEIFAMSWEGENSLNLPLHIIPIKESSNHQRALVFSGKVQEKLFGFDAVLGFNKMPGLDFYFAGDVCFQYVKTQHKPFWYRWLPRYRQYLALEKSVFSLQSKTHVFLLTEKQKREYQFCYRTDNERITLVPPGIEKNNYSAAEMATKRRELRQALDIEEGEIVWLFIASHFHTKGLDRVMSALAELHFPGTRLWVIGGDKENDYQRMAEDLGIEHRVRFLGARDHVQRYMLAADVLVNPARVESAGMAVVEALSMGLPVILTENCGYAFHVNQAEAGIVLPADFALNDLVTALQDALSPVKRRLWQQNALYYGQETDLYGLGKAVVRLIEKHHDKH